MNYLFAPIRHVKCSWRIGVAFNYLFTKRAVHVRLEASNLPIDYLSILLHLWCLKLRPNYLQLAIPWVLTALFLEEGSPPSPLGTQDLTGELARELAGDLDLARESCLGRVEPGWGAGS